MNIISKFGFITMTLYFIGTSIYGFFNNFSWPVWIVGFLIYAALMFGVHLDGKRFDKLREESNEKELEEDFENSEKNIK